MNCQTPIPIFVSGLGTGRLKAAAPGSLTSPSEIIEMKPSYPYPIVTELLLDQAVQRIRQAGSPRCVVLFGSRGRGESRPDSDLDLLIIEESDLPRHQRSPRYYHALAGLFPAKDILVYTPEEVQQWANVPNAFVTTALREGKVLYGKPG